ncbi:MAG: response regulator transcription factor [Chloroflexi bacterium]|nr:response regulator transcription factor [Chloroflexota bacterium]
MRQDKILVVDDDPAVIELLSEYLRNAGYTVFTAGDGLAGLKEFFQNQPHLAIIDVAMPKLDGIELCRRIREVSNVPILFLSAKGQEMDKLRGFSQGGDDYITKPVGMKELEARVQAALRRFRMSPTPEGDLAYQDSALSIDWPKHEVSVRGSRVDLTPTEFKLLSVLVQNADRIVTKDQLLDRVWGVEYTDPDSLKWYVSKLRQKLGDDPEEGGLIRTVRGVGYRYQKPGPA